MKFFKKKEQEEVKTPGLAKVKHVIAIESGKGGVGKSTVTANLALALKKRGHTVGLLDGDIYGPSQANMLGKKEGPKANGNFIEPVDRDNSFSQKYGLVDKFVVLHSGRLGVAQDLTLLLKCAKDLKEYSDIKVLIIGEGMRLKILKQFARENNLYNVIFLPYQLLK